MPMPLASESSTGQRSADQHFHRERWAGEDYARQLLRLPDDELIAKLQASNCVTAVLEGKRLAEASASEVASILAVVGLVA